MQLSVDSELLSLLRDTGVVARVVLVILIFFATWSWGIIISKAFVLSRAERQSRRFWRIFSSGKGIGEIRAAVTPLRASALVPVFECALRGMGGPAEALEAEGVGTGTPHLKAVQRSMHRAAAAQLTRLERHLNFLATTAAVTPFVGLFGTVWGVMTAFLGMAHAQQTSIQAVAPGIAEALITTAFGLLAAIPAVIAYNHFLYRIRLIGGDLDDLQAEMMAIAEEGGV